VKWERVLYQQISLQIGCNAVLKIDGPDDADRSLTAMKEDGCPTLNGKMKIR